MRGNRGERRLRLAEAAPPLTDTAVDFGQLQRAILANVLLETEEGTMRLTATDLEVGARVSIPARVVGKGAITVSALAAALAESAPASANVFATCSTYALRISL